jgi:hypothetical protein
MDDRSRKLLSKDALPKAMRPEPQAHVKREFRLPGAVAGAPADASSLRSRALGAMAAATNGTPMPAPLATPAVGSAPVPAPQTAAIRPAPPAPAKAKGKRGKTPRPQLPSPKARASSPPPVALTKPPAEVAERLWPAIGTPVPPPMDMTQEIVELPDPSLKTPAPLPPPPVVHKPEPAGLTPAPQLVIASKGEQFREATSMWFQRGDEEAERALVQAQRDALEDQAERDASIGLTSRWGTLAAAAAGGLATVLVILHFV